MADNVSVREEILDAFPFLDGDQRWNGAVEVVRREVSYPDGNVRMYTDLRLRIGQRWLVLPRRGAEEVIQAMEAGRDAAESHHASSNEQAFRAAPPSATPREQPSPQRRRVFDAEKRNGRRGGRNTEF